MDLGIISRRLVHLEAQVALNHLHDLAVDILPL